MRNKKRSLLESCSTEKKLDIASFNPTTPPQRVLKPHETTSRIKSYRIFTLPFLNGDRINYQCTLKIMLHFPFYATFPIYGEPNMTDNLCGIKQFLSTGLIIHPLLNWKRNINSVCEIISSVHPQAWEQVSCIYFLKFLNANKKHGSWIALWCFYCGDGTFTRA